MWLGLNRTSPVRRKLGAETETSDAIIQNKNNSDGKIQ